MFLNEDIIDELTRKQNFGSSAGFETMVSALARQCSIKLAMNTLKLGAAQFVELILTREWEDAVIISTFKMCISAVQFT